MLCKQCGRPVELLAGSPWCADCYELLWFASKTLHFRKWEALRVDDDPAARWNGHLHQWADDGGR